MFTMPLHRDILVTSISDASTLNLKKRMTEIMHHVRDPAAHKYSGSIGTLGDTIHGAHSGESTPTKKSPSLQSSHENSPLRTTTGSRILIKTPPASRSDSLKNINYEFKKGATQSTSISLSDVSASNSQFFEVMYVGKIKVSHKRVPITFIDDALPKFQAYDAQRLQRLQEQQTRRNSDPIEPTPQTPTIEAVPPFGDQSRRESEADVAEIKEFRDKILNTKLSEDSKQVGHINPDKLLLRGQSHAILPMKKDDQIPRYPTKVPLVPTIIKITNENEEDVPRQRDRSASIGSIPVYEQNRTMVLLIGKTDFRLISPDKKQILLYKEIKDIVSCIRGQKNNDHFGIISREDKTEGYIGYVFKCQSYDVTGEIVTTISQSIITYVAERKKERSGNYQCEHCPMLWYHRLCNDIEGMSDKKRQITIFRRIEGLSDEEQDIIMEKYYGAEDILDQNLIEQNKFLLLMLRAHCESRQLRHVHDTAENRSEFLNQYLGGSTIFMKAKRSLSSSFDHLLKRKSSKDDFGHVGLVNEPVNPVVKTVSSNRIAAENESSKESQVKSKMMDIFMKVGNSPKPDQSNPVGSWRQEILHRVVSANDLENSAKLRPARKSVTERRTKEELRELWRTAIRQIIVLARMEKENARLQAQHNENEIKKIKLDYDEIISCSNNMWEKIIDHEQRQITKRDQKVLLQAIKNGVPRNKRGEVWMFLADQSTINSAPVDAKMFPNYNKPYGELLKCLTEHQHAIFIDLGRTFPNHKFYKQSLGIGQLSLFNLLKAYSILDPELGYCQGLGFICGVLLLHLNEEDAFQLLKHLMFRRQMRTKYLPDMKSFQLQLYQMSRLLKDYLPDLYSWFDRFDISPTLYAASWILTVFSSQFPLGFVTRVFDLLFLESHDVVFKVGIALLEVHKAEIMKYDSCEDIMDYIKDVLPKIDATSMEKIMRKVFLMDITRQLSEYQVEYNVLKEEMAQQSTHLENLRKSQEENRSLNNQLLEAHARVDEIERARQSQQKQTHVMETQMKGLEVTIDVLGQFILQLIEEHHDIEIPGEVRRIVQQLDQIDQATTAKPPAKLVERKIAKSKSLNHLGLQLRALEELNESLEKDFPTPKENKTFFNGTDLKELAFDSITIERDIPVKEVIITPVAVENQKETTPKQQIPSLYDSVLIAPTEDEYKSCDIHPLSNCGDVNFRFHGTTQLKQIRPAYTRHHSASPLRSLSNSSSSSEIDKNVRS